MKSILSLTLTALTILVIARLIDGFYIDTWQTAVLVALVLWLFNFLVKPIVFVLTLPLTIITFGLFTYVLNALMLFLVPYFVSGFSLDGFLPALFGSLILTLVRSITGIHD